MRQTGRTETSKYPEEKKSTEISLVAASERELALKLMGVSGTFWKGWRYRVIAPYTKTNISEIE